jgi:hypothetical protein
MCVGILLKLESVEICHAPIWHSFMWPSDDLVLLLFMELSGVFGVSFTSISFICVQLFGDLALEVELPSRDRVPCGTPTHAHNFNKAK